MKRIKTLLARLVSLFVFNAEAIAEEDPAGLMAMGAYVASDDLSGSVAFYSTLLDRSPIIELEGFVAFDIAGGWFALVSRAQYAPDATPGSGAVPYIRVSDLQSVRARAALALGEPAPDIIVEPGISLLKITDPNGQLVEFFMLTPP